MREERECTRGKNMMGHSLMEERMCVCKCEREEGVYEWGKNIRGESWSVC